MNYLEPFISHGSRGRIDIIPYRIRSNQKETMPQALPSKTHFVRGTSTLNPGLMVSTCTDCGAFIAASPIEARLRLAERTHSCQVATATTPKGKKKHSSGTNRK